MRAATLLLFLAPSAEGFTPRARSPNSSHPAAQVRRTPAPAAEAGDDRLPPPPDDLGRSLRGAAAALLLGLSVLTGGGGGGGGGSSSYPILPTHVVAAPPALAAESSRVIGEIAGSGLVFKDTLVTESFDDPKVRGVTLYVSSFQRPLSERLQKDFFSEPGFASVGCAKTGPIAVSDNIVVGKGGEEVFKESKSLLFKSLRVQRIYDEEKKTAVYVSFNTRLDKNDDSNKSRFKSSTCAVNLE